MFEPARRTLLFRMAIFTLFMLSMAKGLWAAPLPTADPFTAGWEAYDAGNIEKALKIWDNLAQKGNVDAQLNLGILFDTGQGVEENPKMAAQWYRAAAQKGNRDAQYSLGLMYTMGRGVPEDRHQAANWLHLAALQDLPMAQLELGLLFARGLNPKSYPWQPENMVLPAPLTTSERNVNIPQVRQNIAAAWLYQAGITYLTMGDSKGAWQALDAIHRHAGRHPLEEALQGEIKGRLAVTGEDHPSRAYAGASIGTAWPIASGYVVTNSHVVEDSREVLLITESGQEISAWTVLRDEANDIALLEVNDASKLPPAIPLSSTQADLGAWVFTVGFPRIDEMGDAPKQTQGVISQLHGLQDDPLSYQTTVPIQPGNSGGPLINMRGEAVGVIRAMIGRRGETAGELEPLPNASCALKIECVKDLEKLLPRRQPALRELPPASDNPGALSEQIKGSVLIVVAR